MTWQCFILLTALYCTEASQVPHAIIFECIPPDGRVGDPGQWGFCRVQGGHYQCGPIARRRSYEGMCEGMMLFWGLCLMCMIDAFLSN